MKKTKLLITALLVSSMAYAAEIKINADAAYTFNILNKYEATSMKNKAVFQPKLPIKLGIKFNPSEINLKGSFNIENLTIDGTFKDKEIFKGFSIDGDVNFLSSKLVKGLRVASNFRLIALDGNKFRGTIESGDVDLELGLNYDFGKVNTGALAYYKSNAIMTPKLIGMTFTVDSDQINTGAKFRLAYNLEEYLGLNVYNPNNLDYTDLKENNELYYYDSDSKINKLVPLVLELEGYNKKEVLENLSISSSLNANLKYSDFDGNLKKVTLNSTEADELKEAVKKAIADDGADKTEIRDLIKSKLKGKGNAEEVKYTKLNFNISGKIVLDYNIFEGLDMKFSDQLGLKYSYVKEPESINILLTNKFNTSLKYVYEFEQIDGLSLIHNSNLSLNSEVKLKGQPAFSIKSVDGEFKSSEYTHISLISVAADIAVKYNIFETLSIKGGLGIELQGIVGKEINGFIGKYNQTIPKIFIGASYEW